MTRYQANKLILKYLQRYIEKNPQLRFGQILINLSIVHEDCGAHDYYTESEAIWRYLHEKKKN